jgi:hypothetical protein
MSTINTTEEREFACNLLSYLHSNNEDEVRLRIYNMADEIDHLRYYIVQLECAVKNLTEK